MPVDEADLGIQGPEHPEGSDPKAGGAGQGGDKGKGGDRDFRRELKALQDRNRELEGTVKAYESVLQRTGRQQPEPEPEPEPDELDEIEDPVIEGDDAEKFTDDISRAGADALKRRGFVTRREAAQMARRAAEKAHEKALRQIDERIDSRAQRMTSDAKLIAQFPDLGDEESELYKLTKQFIQDAAKEDPEGVRSPVFLKTCARAAQAELKARGRGEEGEEDQEEEQPPTRLTREQRIERQAGPRGRNGGDFRQDRLSPLAQEMIRGMGISEEEYRAQQRPTTGQGRGRR